MTVHDTTSKLAGALLGKILNPKSIQPKPKFPDVPPVIGSPKGVEALVPANLRWVRAADGTEVAMDHSYAYKRKLVNGAWQYSRKSLPPPKDTEVHDFIARPDHHPTIVNVPSFDDEPLPPEILRVESGATIEVADDYIHLPPNKHSILTLADLDEIQTIIQRRSSRPPAK